MIDLAQDNAADAARRHALVRIRRGATFLLAAVTAVFGLTFLLGDAVWVGFLRATAEAAMVGGVADWFAVVALFRHPLGLPIPHTAVIPESKEGLGANLATFVSDNFLDPDDLTTRLTDADLAARAGHWLESGDNATQTAARLSQILVSLLDDMDADRMATGLVDATVRGLESLPSVELAGRGLDAAIANGQHHQLLTVMLSGVRTAIEDNSPLLRQRLYAESPRWVPPALDDIVFDRAVAGLTRFLAAVSDDPNHPVRDIVDQRLQGLARSLQQDPTTAETVRSRIRSLAESPEIRDWAIATWEEVSSSVKASADDADSPLRRSLERRLSDLAGRLQHDDEVRARINEWVTSVAPAIARESRTEIAALVAGTVDRWDPEETSDRLELWLGRDLQFVRINGTVVGGMVGFALHAVTLALGG